MSQMPAPLNIRHRTSVVCVHNDCLLTFHAIDPTTKKEYLFLPGGMIEEGETAVQAAERETWEETGYKVQVDKSSLIEASYDFDWNGRVQHCHTLFFSAQLAEAFHPPGVVNDASYNVGVIWLPLDQVSEKMNYHPAIFGPVTQLLHAYK